MSAPAHWSSLVPVVVVTLADSSDQEERRWSCHSPGASSCTVASGKLLNNVRQAAGVEQINFASRATLAPEQYDSRLAKDHLHLLLSSGYCFPLY